MKVSSENSSRANRMKTFIVLFVLLAGLTANVFGQGQVLLGNNSSSLVYYLNPQTPAPVGSLNVQLYAAAGSNQPQSSLVAVGPIVGIGPVDGRIQSTTVDVPQAPNGQVATFQIWVWSNQYATRNQAFAAGGFVGASQLFESNTSYQAPGDPPPTAVILAGKFPAFGVVPIPEPTSFALTFLGSCCLLFHVRKKLG